MSVRVGFAIRPTGQPGEGLTLCQARDALYGWLYARHEGGALVLHVAGGDLPPATRQAIETFCEELRWLGIDWDEGPTLEAGEHSGALPQILSLPDIVFPGSAAPDPDTLSAYRARGYLPLAMANHLARLGWTPRGKRELLALPELAARFDLQRVSRAPVTFDLQQLNWFNRRALCALDVREVTALLVPRWQEAYLARDRAAGTALTPVEWQQALALALREELDHLDQAVERARFAFLDDVMLEDEAREVLSQPYAPEVLRAFVRELPAVEPFCYEPIDAWVTDLRQRFKAALGPTQGVRSRDVMYVLRAALTGRMDGPCLVEVCQLLGQERCTRRALGSPATRYDKG